MELVIIRLSVCFILLCYFLASQLSFSAEALKNQPLHPSPGNKPVVFVTSVYAPYVINADGVASGMFPDIVTAAFREMDHLVQFQFQPWVRGELSVKSGAAFATFPYLKTGAREKEFDFSEPVLFFYPKFFYSTKQFPYGFEWETLADFKQYRVGGVRGYWYEANFIEAGIEAQYVTSDKQNIEMLLLQRIDFTLIDELVGWNLIRETAPEQLATYAVASKPQSSDAFHLMISRDYPNAKMLKLTFNLGLLKIKQKGIYQQILGRYHVTSEYATP
ncbi:transporter substrate-binding domain-containing protein [Shewanella eurypsychrophilus]|uniref:Transporter substrate-binding domain-containing protein n=2 Tax=Shewanellaceae TaxID=267890 RepID=A0ABX6VDI7_9GAMM|nr:transporter substrate-binding domain-containing protein [Shewanella sp. YLB-09]QPG60429.1 transporter substrate-binding domain-containing protein [Shewanella eurypsychrophilus]